MRNGKIDIEKWFAQEGNRVRNMPARVVTEKDDWSSDAKRPGERQVQSVQQVLTQKGADVLNARRWEVYKGDRAPLSIEMITKKFGHGSHVVTGQEVDALNETPF